MKKIIAAIQNLGLVGAVQYLFPEAGKDAVVTIVAWVAYWAVRIVRTILKKRWTLQGLIKRRFASPLSFGLALDVLWEVLNTNHTRKAPWYLNWVPVVWVNLHWWWVKPLCILIILLTFWDVIFPRVTGLIKRFFGLPSLPSSGGDGSDDPFS